MTFENLADLGLLLLSQCIACDGDAPTIKTFPICSTCENALLPGINPAYTTDSGRSSEWPSDWINSQYSLFQLTDSAYPVLRRWKTRRGPLFDRRVLKRVDHASLKNYLCENKIEAVIPIPQNYRRSWKMGGSPALKLASFIGRAGGIPVLTRVLDRTKNSLSKRQAELPGWQRKQTKLHFHARENELGLRSVLIVDDFSTTGHTLEEAARVVKKAGYGKTHALCLGARNPGSAQRISLRRAI
jgi:predicted amidophosphoribosyltransferase